MSILSDKQIRARSLVPTHSYLPPNYKRMFFTLVGDQLYNTETGEKFSTPEHTPDWLAQEKVKVMTESEQQGYCVAYPRMIDPFVPDLIRNKAHEVPPFWVLHPEFTQNNWERWLAWDKSGFDAALAPPDAVLDEEWMFRDHKRLLEAARNDKIVSYGTSSYGYDVRCADEFKIFTNINSTVVDPKNFDEKTFVDFKGDVCIIPPNSFALARTVERMKIPRNVLTVCLGKSTYARCGIIVNVTPFEPEWEGYVTLEFSNTTPLPAKIYANEGCAQVLFFKSDDTCEVSYADRGGKYQGQAAEVVCPKV
jgi:dCTP deaminase